MRFFRNFHDLRGHSRGNRRSDLIFMGGGGTIYSVCSLSVSNAGWHAISHNKLQAYTLYLHLQVYNIIVLSFALFVYVLELGNGASNRLSL